MPTRPRDEARGLRFRVRRDRERGGGELHTGVGHGLGLADRGDDPGHVPRRAVEAVAAEAPEDLRQGGSLPVVEHFAVSGFGWIVGHHCVALLAS